MGLIEQYEREIQEQKGLSEKLETSKRWLRDAKQGKLVNKSTMKGMELIVPEGVTYTPSVEAYYKTTALINHIQADFEYLKSLGEGKQELEKGSIEKNVLPDTKKIIWLGTQAELIALFHLLHSGRAKLIDQKSFNVRKARIRDHFLDDLRSRGKGNGVKPFDNGELGTVEDNMNLKAECKSLLNILQEAYENLPA